MSAQTLRPTLTNDELIEDIEFLVDQERIGLTDAGRRVGLTRVALEQRLRRLDRRDLLGALIANDVRHREAVARVRRPAQWLKTAEGRAFVADAEKWRRYAVETWQDTDTEQARRRRIVTAHPHSATKGSA